MRWYSSDHGRRGRVRYGRSHAFRHRGAAVLQAAVQSLEERSRQAGRQQAEDRTTAIQTAGANEDIPALLAALKAVGKTAARLEQYPAPACADPHGYWKKILARIQAAGDNAGADTGLTGLILAEAPLKDVPALEKKLDAELKRTT